MFPSLDFCKKRAILYVEHKVKGDKMDKIVLETCISCERKALCFRKKKKKYFSDIYLSVCYGCPYEMEFKIFSGNEESELLLTTDNIRYIVGKINSGDVYRVEKTNAKVNVFFNNLKRKVDKSERPQIALNFIKYLTWSDRLKPFMIKLFNEINFQQSL